MRILITGGAGFIGSHSAEHLVALGHEVVILDDLSNGSLANLSALHGQTAFHHACLLDAEALTRAMRGCDAVLHLAAAVSVTESIEQPFASHAANATGTLHVLDIARRLGIDRVVLASSAAVYGLAPAQALAEEAPTSARSPYAAQKALGETYARLYADLYGMSPIALRYFNVFGPRQDPRSPYSGVLSRFIAAIVEDEPVTIYGDGQQTRDFVHVEDVAAANALALTAPTACAGAAVNIGTGTSRSLLEALDALEAAAGRRLPAPRFEAARAGDLRHSCAAIDRAKFLLGFKPRVGFEAGLAQTMAWVRGHAPAKEASLLLS